MIHGFQVIVITDVDDVLFESERSSGTGDGHPAASES